MFHKVLTLILIFMSLPILGGDFVITGEKLPEGLTIVDKSCFLRGQNVFSSDATNTKISNKYAYKGDNSVEMTIEKGHKGFGSFGGIINFRQCLSDTPKVYKGGELWVRLRMYIPESFEFNQYGRNKFLRFRTYHVEDGKYVSEGFNDLYLDARNLNNVNSSPYDYIFEGKQRWYQFGVPKDFLKREQWETIEYYIKLDDKTRREGGDSVVRVWVNGKLVGETFDRATLKTPDSFVTALYLFTYWHDKGSHKTQSLYVDDIFLTTNFPDDFDSNGNRYIGMADGHTIPWQTMQCPAFQ